MANSCENLIGKFVYQVYPLLREYYKDGILVKLNNGTPLGLQIEGVPDSITIEPPMSPQALHEILKALCPENASVESVAPISAGDAEGQTAKNDDAGAKPVEDTKMEDAAVNSATDKPDINNSDQAT